MNYFSSMARLICLDHSKILAFSLKHRQMVCIFNIAVLGLLYGLSAAFFSQSVLVEKGFEPSAANNLKIIIAGLPVAFLMHAGASLFAWVFFKAVGGKAPFILAYYDIGVAAISIWPLAPVVAAVQTGSNAGWVNVLAWVLSLYGLCVILSVMKSTFALSRPRMALAGCVTVIYISCFLYLWI